MKKHYLKIIAGFIVYFSIVSSSGLSSPDQYTNALWKEELNRYPVISAAKLLNRSGVTVGEDKNIGRWTINFKIHGGLIYFSDTYNHQILIYDPKSHIIRSFGQKGKGPGDFFRNTGIDVGGNRIFVNDIGNKRIQIFDLSGDYRSSFKCFENYSSLNYHDRKLYLARSNSLISQENVTMDIFDIHGDYKRSIISFENLKLGSPLKYDVLCDIDQNNGNILLCLAFCPVLSVYSTHGTLVKTIKVDYPTLRDNSSKNDAARYNKTSQSIRLKTLIFDVKIIGASIYLLLQYPRVMILELDLHSGQMINSYYFVPKTFSTYYGKMHIQFKNHSLLKNPIFTLLQVLPSNQLFTYEIKDQDLE